MSKLLTKTEKADSLFRMSYRAALSGPDILVRNPAGAIYRVDVVAGTCSCQATVRACSHLLGAHRLLLDQANALAVQAQDEIECVQNCWRYSEAGMKLASKANRLSDRAFEILGLFECAGILPVYGRAA